MSVFNRNKDDEADANVQSDPFAYNPFTSAESEVEVAAAQASHDGWVLGGGVSASAPVRPARRGGPRRPAAAPEPAKAAPALNLPLLAAGGAAAGAALGAAVAANTTKGVAVGVLLGGGLPLLYALATGALELGG